MMRWLGPPLIMHFGDTTMHPTRRIGSSKRITADYFRPRVLRRSVDRDLSALPEESCPKAHSRIFNLWTKHFLDLSRWRLRCWRSPPESLPTLPIPSQTKKLPSRRPPSTARSNPELLRQRLWSAPPRVTN